MVDGDPVELSARCGPAGLAFSASCELPSQTLHLLAAGRVIADHSLGEFAALVVLAPGFGPFGDFNLIAARPMDAGRDLLIGRSRLSLLKSCGLRELTWLARLGNGSWLCGDCTGLRGDCTGLRDWARLAHAGRLSRLPWN